MRVLLVDDEHLALDIIEVMLKKIDGIEIEIVGKFTNPEKVLAAIKSLKVDVVFLDMEMGPVHGLELAEDIMSRYSYIQIIFVTAHAQFALEAFEVNAIDYLLKPIRSERLVKAVKKAEERLPIYNDKNHQEGTVVETMPFVYAMGRFKLVEADKKIIKWRTRKVQELFVFLWHHRCEPVHKARVVEELWPDMDAIRAVRLLHTTVYQLRKTLRDIGFEQAIKLVNDHYVLTSPILSDVEEIEEIIDSKQLSAKNIKNLLHLYCGEYLAEEDYQWASQEQKELREKTLHFLEEFILKEQLNQENPLLMQQCLEKMVEFDEYNEGYILRLLTFYGEMKNIQKLIEFYQARKKSFEEELGVKIPVTVQQMFKHYLQVHG